MSERPGRKFEYLNRPSDLVASGFNFWFDNIDELYEIRNFYIAKQEGKAKDEDAPFDEEELKRSLEFLYDRLCELYPRVKSQKNDSEVGFVDHFHMLDKFFAGLELFDDYLNKK